MVQVEKRSTEVDAWRLLALLRQVVPTTYVMMAFRLLSIFLITYKVQRNYV